MAFVGNIRVPTLGEMENARDEELMVTSCKHPVQLASKMTKTLSDTSLSSTSATNYQPDFSTSKHISHKALLSRQPLSASCSVKCKTATVRSSSTELDKLLVQNSNVPSTERPIDAMVSQAGLTGQQAVAQDSNDNRSSSVTATMAAGVAPPATVNTVDLPLSARIGTTKSLIVNPRQKGNPILSYVRNVPWEFGSVVPDYVMGQGNCALFLRSLLSMQLTKHTTTTILFSFVRLLRYHQLHPDYIHQRLKQLGHSYDLRVLLVLVDIKDSHLILKDMAKICILSDCTLMVAFSAEEAGQYLEAYKIYEHKAVEAIMERQETNLIGQVTDCLTKVKAVNRTDCSVLLSTFGNVQCIMEASVDDLSLCPGFGPQKAKRLHDVFREPFLVSQK